jgi:uncharacterized coiled-coil protein SlyX
MLQIDESRFYDILSQVLTEHSFEDDEIEEIVEELLTKLQEVDETVLEEDSE